MFPVFLSQVTSSSPSSLSSRPFLAPSAAFVPPFASSVSQSLVAGISPVSIINYLISSIYLVHKTFYLEALEGFVIKYV